MAEQTAPVPKPLIEFGKWVVIPLVLGLVGYFIIGKHLGVARKHLKSASESTAPSEPVAANTQKPATHVTQPDRRINTDPAPGQTQVQERTQPAASANGDLGFSVTVDSPPKPVHRRRRHRHVAPKPAPAAAPAQPEDDGSYGGTIETPAKPDEKPANDGA